MVVCEKCKMEAELITIDQGGYEEFWGVRCWSPYYVAVTECCDSEDYETIEETARGNTNPEHS